MIRYISNVKLTSRISENERAEQRTKRESGRERVNNKKEM